MSDELFQDEQKKDNKIDPDALAVRNMVVNPGGRAYIWKHLQSCGVFETIFDNDPIQHSYNAGLREAGLMLKRNIESYEPLYYIKMIEENING